MKKRSSGAPFRGSASAHWHFHERKKSHRTAGGDQKDAPAVAQDDEPPRLKRRDQRSPRARARNAPHCRALARGIPKQTKYAPKTRWPSIGRRGGPQPPQGASVLDRIVRDGAGMLVRSERSRALGSANRQRDHGRPSLQPRIPDKAQKSRMAQVGSAAEGTSAVLALYAYAGGTGSAARTDPKGVPVNPGR